MKNTLKKLLIILLISIFISTFYISIVLSTSDFDDKIKETEENLEAVRDDRSKAQKEVDKLNDQIDNYEVEISNIEVNISNLEKDIEVNLKKIEELENKLNLQNDLLEKRLIVMYESGSTGYLDVLLSSNTITDFLSKYYMVSEVVSYDLELLQSIKAQKEEVTKTKETLINDKDKLGNAKREQTTKTNNLKTLESTKKTEIANLTSKEKTLQADLEQFKKDKAELQRKIAAQLKKEQEARDKEYQQNNGNSNNGGNNTTAPPNTSGFRKPINGYNITTGFYGYADHTGADFSGANIYGKPVLASKAGTVFTSIALTGTINGYRSYGEHVVINHHDGTMTLYAHGKPGSRLVSEGQKVSQGQQIMSVGNTGNVKPRPSANNPLAGTHLHFEIQVYINGNRTYVNPANYL